MHSRTTQRVQGFEAPKPTPMIVGVLLHDEKTRETLFRSPKDYEREFVTLIVQTFTRTRKSASGIFASHTNYVYSSRNGVFVCVVTTYPPYVVQPLLQTYVSCLSASIIDNLCLIDDTINDFSFFPLPAPAVDQYRQMESQEEKLYDLMAKNRETEMVERMKELRRKETNDAFNEHLEKVRELELEIRKPPAQPVKKEAKEVFRERKKASFVDSEIQVLVKEKLKVVIDRDSNLKSCEIDGDLSIHISREEFRECSLQISTDAELKYSPNLDKEKVRAGVLKAVRGFPVGKNLALAKWKRSEIDSLPLSFTFWPSELDDGRYQIMFEVSGEENLRDVIFCFNREKVRDVVVETGDVETKDFLEWNVGVLEKNQTEMLEFSCGCLTPGDLFPINLFFTGDFSSSPLSVEAVEGSDGALDFSLVNLSEVDSFVIVDE